MNRCSKITYITIYLIDMKKVLSYGKIFLMMKSLCKIEKGCEMNYKKEKL